MTSKKHEADTPNQVWIVMLGSFDSARPIHAFSSAEAAHAFAEGAPPAYVHGSVPLHERPIEQARARVVEAAKAWAQHTCDCTLGFDIGDIRGTSPDLVTAVAELERLEAEARP